MLFDNDRNVSEKSLQEARVVMQTDRAKWQSATTAQSSLDATMRQQFGDALAGAAMRPRSALFQRLLDGRAVVLRVTLPTDYDGAPPARVTVDARNGVIAASKLSASLQTDPAIQGSPYFYVADVPLPLARQP